MARRSSNNVTVDCIAAGFRGCGGQRSKNHQDLLAINNPKVQKIEVVHTYLS